MKKERFKVCCAVYMIVRQDNKILFLKRQNTGYMDGYYALPAGHLEEGECITKAAVREIYEEIGIAVKEQDLNLIFTGNQVAPNKEYIDLFFEVNKYTGCPKNNEPEKSSEMGFFELDEIEKDVIPYTAKALRAIQNKKTFLVSVTNE